MSLAFSTFISLTISITSPLMDIQTEKLEYTCLIVVAMSSLLIMIQNVYCFNLIRNPLFCAIDASKSIKWGFKLLNMTKFSVCPVVLSLYYNHLFKSYHSYTWFQTVLLGRAFREIWQNNQHCQAATSLFVIIRLSSDSVQLTNTDPITSLWLCSVFVYFLKKGLRRLHVCFKLQFDFVALKKQRRKESHLITAANVIFLPVVICVAMVTAGLNIPLLPLFTLPVFCISFPRPTKFWPDASTSHSCSRDSAFYKQVTPHYLSALASDVKHNLACGSFFVSRVENLLIFSHVLESGFGYASLLMKGLELQETSCHTEEVNVVKDIFDRTFEGTKCYNDFFMHMLQPLSKTNVLTYSDAKNVLTGVLDSPTCLERLAGNFRKCLTYFLCTQYPKCGESIQYEGTVLVSNQATTTSTSTAKGAAPSTSRGGGFDFSGLHNKAATGVGDVLEDATSTATLVSNNRSEDFLDNLSFNCSEESWFEQVLVNKTTHSPVKSEDNEIKPKSIRGDETTHSSVKSEDNEIKPKSIRAENCNELDSDSNNFIDEEERIVLEVKNGGGEGGEECGVPGNWLKVPFCREEVEKECENFPLDLFRSKSSVHAGLETVSGLVSSAYLALQNSSSGVNKSANQVVKTYSGNVYFGKCKQWIEENSELKRLLITSYRFAVKLSIDETVFGDNETLEEYFDSMLALERDWYIGLETDPAWQKSLEESKQFVFTLGFNKEGVYASRTLSLTKLPMLTGQLNSENVRSIWSALSLELLYLTNDDEERYSIQAHPNILRNIVTQSADLPLGYPVYSSGLQHVSTL
ncbi:pecanex-like protein 4 [Bolinopsis microptera]|uniref:pecanex-like protein 4 n=1 Tax=Bolinopsis microptera TaxID=2820187 RepID=UPI00307964C4